MRRHALCGAALVGMLVLMAGCGSTESATTTTAPSSPNLPSRSDAQAAAAKAAAAKARSRERASEKAHERARERRERQHDKVVAEEKAKREAEDVSPACETARESLKLEEGNPSGNPRYIAEDKEVVQEECGAAGRKRWARVKNESPREGQCKVARMLLNEAVADDIPSYIREGEAMVAASCGA